MNRFSMWFANFMRGRYGMDQFGRFLMICALILIVANFFLPWRILDMLTLLLLIYTYCRMFSRNIDARFRENQKFLQMSEGMRSKFGGNGRSGGYEGSSGYGGGYGSGNGYRGSRPAPTRDDKHKILRCPGCGEKLRVPKGAGKIEIRCPHCGTKFTKKV